MAQPGVFQLVVRDERFDGFFTCSDYLRQRMRTIRANRAAAGFKNVQPTFADLEKSHVMFLRAIYRPYVALACEYVRVKASGDGAALTPSSGKVSFTFPIYGHFTSDLVFHVRFANVGTANPVLAGPGVTNPSPRYRYCAYPGIRLFEAVELTSDQAVIDDYVRDEVLLKSKLMIGADQRSGWDRGLGQQELKTGEFYNSNGFTGCIQYKDGLQTPKFFQPTQDLWIPAQFWMCQDASHALLNDLIPNTQRQVTATLAPLQLLVQQLNQVSGEIEPLSFDKLGLQIDLYVNNIFVNPEVHQVFSSRVGFTLIRVHRRQRRQLNLGSETIRLNHLKYPAEYLWMGIRDRETAADFDQWVLFGRRRSRTMATALLQPAAIWNSTLAMCQLVCRNAKETSTLEPLLEDVTLRAHGVPLWPEKLPVSFFNTYLPQRYYQNTSMVSPMDTSVYHYPFCLYPGQHNPSGLYNLSAGRELELTYDSHDQISTTNPAELIVAMSALNFLVRSGDRLSLRYSV